MKQIMVAACATALLALSSGAAFADTATPAEKSAERQKDRQENRATRQEQRQENRATRQEQRQDNRKTRQEQRKDLKQGN